MRSAFRTALGRSITGSLGRFLAIAGIVALGCGFYAGLRMTGTDMRAAGDAFMDGTSLYDLRLVSTLGFSQEQVDAVAAVDGVDQVQAGYATDVMATLNEEQYAIRVMSLDTTAAEQSTVDATGTVVTSSDDGYLNRLVLASGSWPSSASECVLSADRVMGTPIQVGDTVTVLYGTASLDGVLETRTFTVSGLVHSSAYLSSVGLGYTSLGSGIIQQYMYVSPQAFSADLPYTELSVTVSGARYLQSGTDAYQAKVDEVAARIDDGVPSLAASRLSEVKATAQETLDEQKDTYESEKSDAEQQLADARQELDDALAELESARDQIASGEESLTAGTEELAAARAQVSSQLASGRATLDASWATWRSGSVSWQTQRAQLLAQKDQASAAGKAVSAASDAVTADLAKTPGLTAADVAATQKTLASATTALDALEGSLASGTDEASVQAKALFEQGKQVVAGLSSIYSGFSATIAATGAPLIPASNVAAAIRTGGGTGTDLAAAMTQVATGVSTAVGKATAAIDSGVAEGDAKVANGKSQLDAAEVTFASQKASAEAQLEASQAQLDAAAEQLDTAREELASGEASYAEGVSTYESNAAEVDSRLSDAASQLAAAQKDIDAIEAPNIYVLDRTKSVGVQSYHDDSVRMDNIAAVFPFIFFLVAALVALTTMTRMVEDDRVEIGTYKALGFSTARITSKYLVYAAIASVAGSIVGIAILSQVLPAVVEKAYAIIYNVPAQAFPLKINLGIALLALGLGVGVTLLATWGAAAATLREAPATLMLPRAPKAGKRILLERMGPVWHRLSFSWKVTFRNLFRYKRRLAMTVIGIAGCTALLLTGLGLHDAIWDIIDNQYEGASPVFHFNVEVGLDGSSSTPDADVASAESTLSSTGGASSFAVLDNENMQVSSASHPNTLAVSVMIPNDIDAFRSFVTMRDRTSGSSVAFDSHSVVLTEKIANRLGVGVGDTFRVYEQDDIGNATGDGYEFTVTGITENYVYHYCYVSVDAWRSATGKDVTPNMVLASVDSGEEARSRLASALHENSSVKTVVFNTETIDSYRKSLQSVNMIVVVLVVAAAALAFIVLYNLTNINIVERMREIASLKVLGFSRREVAAYVFREIALLVVLGAAVGLLLGIAMEGFVVVSSEVDAVMFGRAIHSTSFAWAFALTLGFSVLVMLAMLPKLAHIDMVESLKSVD